MPGSQSGIDTLVKVTLWPTSGTKSEMVKSALGGAATAVCATASGHSTAMSTAKERLRGAFTAPPGERPGLGRCPT